VSAGGASAEVGREREGCGWEGDFVGGGGAEAGCFEGFGGGGHCCVACLEG
jgi:hypothetical protein